MNPIRFRGELRFLSNFYPARVYYDEDIYPSVEHAYQAAKTLDTNKRIIIRDIESPVKAKAYGSDVDLREDWNQVKIPIMYELVNRKFEILHLRDRLLSVKESDITETNLWHDMFWGKCVCVKHKGEGLDNLGKIIRQVRRQILYGERRIVWQK